MTPATSSPSSPRTCGRGSPGSAASARSGPGPSGSPGTPRPASPATHTASAGGPSGPPRISRIAASVRSLPSFRPGGRAERLLRLRETLEPEEQTLLILRLDKELPWEEVAHVLSEGRAPVAPAALRKRFERLKEKLGKMAKDEGLLD